MKEQQISLRRLARELGITEGSVRKAVKGERLKESIGYTDGGRPFVKDLQGAVAEWQRNRTVQSLVQTAVRDMRTGCAPTADPAEGAHLAPEPDDPPVLIFGCGGDAPISARGMSVFCTIGRVAIVAGFQGDDDAHRIIEIDQAAALQLSEALLRAVLDIQRTGRDDIATAERELAEAASTVN
jgi:hypothetical protein